MASRGRLRSLLVVSQVAVSLVLLVGAGLVLRSYAAAQKADGGFDAANVTSVAIDLQTGRLRRAARARRHHAAARRAGGGAGVRRRQPWRSNVPMSLVDGASRATNIEGYAPRSDEDMLFLYNIVAPDYFRTLRIPLARRP